MKFYIGSSLKNYDKVNELSNILTGLNWEHTFNWAKQGKVENKDIEDLSVISIIEQKAIESSDIVIILLPAGRGAHVELGIAIALNKKIYLYSQEGKEFEMDNTAGFYWHPSIVRVVGDVDTLVTQIKKENLKELKP